MATDLPWSYLDEAYRAWVAERLETYGIEDQYKKEIAKFADPSVPMTREWEIYLEEAMRLGLL